MHGGVFKGARTAKGTERRRSLSLSAFNRAAAPPTTISTTPPSLSLRLACRSFSHSRGPFCSLLVAQTRSRSVSSTMNAMESGQKGAEEPPALPECRTLLLSLPLIAARDSSSTSFLPHSFTHTRFSLSLSLSFSSLKKKKKKQALVDRPDAVRKALNFKRLALTDIKIDIPRAAKKSVLAKALADSGAFEKFAASAWGQKLARREAKAGLTDLERYKASVKRAARAKAIKAKLG